MYPIIKKALNAVHKKLDRTIKSWEIVSDNAEDKNSFHSLSPISNADVEPYLTALKWALDNRKEESIYNIALTGSYGSGKSSILQTFKKTNENKDYVFLEISLATFKEEADEQETPAREGKKVDGKDDKPVETGEKNSNLVVKKNEDILRLIELSILQQIFYHEEDSKIPDSRFKKIRSFKRKNMLWITAGTMATLLFGLNLFFPAKVGAMLKITFSHVLELILHWLSLLVFLASLSIVIYRSIRLGYGINISKLKFHEAEIEIDKNISKSILNNHLDEILYFFEVTEYSVVLIEDLDRFRQAEIFTKLRELNLLINNSKKVKQEVIFIYAVRDEMFSDKDRTKFFDFIIPVIPVINNSNSNEKLAGIIADNTYKISPELVDDISLFIDDMRLLYNITNEYHIYHNLLGGELDQDKLFAIIVYKNIYPDDFVQLNESKGKLFALLNSRQTYISEITTALNIRINGLRAELKNIEAAQVKDANQLRMMYLLAYINKLVGFKNFVINGTAYTPLEVANDEDRFAYIIDDDAAYNYYYSQYGSHYNTQSPTDITFSSIESDVDDEQSYQERLAIINSIQEDREEEIKSEIQNLEKQKTATRHLKLQEILADKTSKINIDTTTRQGLLLKLLIRSGYINEDYVDYISLFYEGSITKEDRSFLLNIKSQSALAYDYSLSKIGNLIGKIRVLDFQQPYLLNYNMLDFLLVNTAYPNQLEYLLNQLNDQSDYGPEFIEGFLTAGVNTETFINKIAAKWPGIYKYVINNSNLTKERIEAYFKLIIANAEIDDIKNIASVSNLANDIADRTDFLSLIDDEDKLAQVITALNIKFKKLDFSRAINKLVDTIIKGNFYQINATMIEKVVQKSPKFNRPDYDTANYKAILESELPEFQAYIKAGINEYLTNVYLVLPNNTKEPEQYFINLLESSIATLPNLTKVIEKVETIITDLGKLNPMRTDDALFDRGKVVPIWPNLIEAFVRQDNSMTPGMINFINSNAETLGKMKINTQKPYRDLLTTEAFMLTILNEADIDDNSYDDILPAIPYDYSVDDVSGISPEKMQMLIEHYTINPNAENFSKLKEDFPGLQLPFLEISKTEFMAAITDFDIDANDIDYVLSSDEFIAQDKETILSAVENDVIAASPKVLRSIAKLIFKHFPFTISKEALISVIKQPLPTTDRVKLFNMHFKQFSMADVVAVFKTFPYPYSDIGVLYTSPVIDYGTENNYLANNLKAGGFIANTKEEKRGIRIINKKK